MFQVGTLLNTQAGHPCSLGLLIWAALFYLAVRLGSTVSIGIYEAYLDHGVDANNKPGSLGACSRCASLGEKNWQQYALPSKASSCSASCHALEMLSTRADPSDRGFMGGFEHPAAHGERNDGNES